MIHCAASLNRKSEKSCLNVNLRGTLEVIQLARRAQHYHGLRRFSHVSTVAVAGKRSNEVVKKITSIDWNRSDYDPYARTKKFCEHMVRQLLPDVPTRFFVPASCWATAAGGDDAVRHGAGVRFSGGAAGAAVPPERPDRHRAGGLRGRSDRDAASESRAAIRDLSSVVRHGVADISRSDDALATAQGKRGPILAVSEKPFSKW